MMCRALSEPGDRKPLLLDAKSHKAEMSFQELLTEAHSPGSKELFTDSPRPASASPDQAPLNVVDSLLDTHIRTDPVPSPVVPTLYCCEICDKTFTQRWILDRHYNTSHQPQLGYEKQCRCGKLVDVNSKHTCTQCQLCSMVFPGRAELRVHVVSCHVQALKKCSICGAEFTSQQHLTKHMIECKMEQGPGDQSEMQCEKCCKTLKSIKQYQKHEDNYNSLSHTCPVCSKRFCLFPTLFTHIWHEHHKANRNASVYHCPICEECFPNFRHHAYHILDLHESNPNNEPTTVISAAKKKRPAKMGKFRKYLYTPEKHQRKKRGQQTQAWTKEGELELEEECAPYTRSLARMHSLTMLPDKVPLRSETIPIKKPKKDPK